VFGRGLGAELLVPVGAKLSAPETLRAAGMVARAERKIGKLADTQASGAGVEGVFHNAGDRSGAGLIEQDFRVVA
jgi:hypothetical protein